MLSSEVYFFVTSTLGLRFTAHNFFLDSESNKSVPWNASRTRN